LCDLAEHRAWPGAHDQEARCALRTEVPMNTQFWRALTTAPGALVPGCVLDRQALAGHSAWLTKTVIGLEHHAVAGNEAAGGEQYHIARNDFGRAPRTAGRRAAP